MDTKICTTNTTLFLFFFLIFSPPLFLYVNGHGTQPITPQKVKPSLRKILMETISMLKKSHKRSWEKFRAIVHDVQLQFFPPNLDFRGAEEPNAAKGEKGAGERMKVAAEKSFGAGKMTAERTAESAAKVVGKAMQSTAEKVKKKKSSPDQEDHLPHDEL